MILGFLVYMCLQDLILILGFWFCADNAGVIVNPKGEMKGIVINIFLSLLSSMCMVVSQFVCLCLLLTSIYSIGV